MDSRKGDLNFVPSTSQDSSIWKNIRNADLTPKLKSFLWRTASNCLPTKGKLSARNIVDSAQCPICHSHEETMENLTVST
ncbi:conserved hypothetical protein [Ricinus communis]|uniref:Reverse transcriptase zinc-binding domain-containing protein n=1 Tax=Ricinus communis TaxID=3988 RepID=B9SE05_RICCO|nr:conserved hypothetical protein [Ricinus communis]